MEFSISNIAWDTGNDQVIYNLMNQNNYTGLEIAPTKIIPCDPYENLSRIMLWKEEINDKWNLKIPSMQSIWYGRQESMFKTEKEREILLEYTKKAICFAEVIGCHNLVFGCPKNRYLYDNVDDQVAISFFKEVGDYAAVHNTVIGMEANPVIYNTNYINETKQAIHLIKEVDSKGFMLNLDIGTMIQNEESASELIGNVELINHVHVSEPRLAPIQERQLHMQIADILMKENYKGYVSIEMGKVDDIILIDKTMQYVKKVFSKVD